LSWCSDFSDEEVLGGTPRGRLAAARPRGLLQALRIDRPSGETPLSDRHLRKGSFREVSAYWTGCPALA
jgi:hypothetical protein